jgi:hypothetical protein
MKRGQIIVGKNDFVQREFEQSVVNALIRAFWAMSPHTDDNFGKVEPPSQVRHTGMLAYSDGTNWDALNCDCPGWVRWDGSKWVLPEVPCYGEAALSSDYNITAAQGTWVGTGLSLTLPSAGTYLVSGDVRGYISHSTSSATAFIVAKLRNTTDAADVTNSERLVTFEGTVNVVHHATVPVGNIVTVSASKTIELYAKRDGSTSPAPTYVNSYISSGANGRTVLRYIRIN